MTDRETHALRFLQKAGWGDATRAALAGDASNRRYERLTGANGEKAVLMDAPPAKGEYTRPFCRIARHLSDLGLSAPKILAEDATHGFLLLEDLGDALFARVLEDAPHMETELYTAATDVLVNLHHHSAPDDLALYDPKIMAEMAALAWRWYLRGAGASYEEKARDFAAKFETILAEHASECDVLIQRDYHAENLLWLPDRSGVARVGLLDFQDAMAGHRAYDLVSMLQDARRDVSPATEDAMIAHYTAATGLDPQAFRAAYHVLGAQRNLRILGVFARLSLHFGKPHYVDFIPRVWGLLLRDLAHPALAPLSDHVLEDLPEPTDTVLQRLKDQCATVPTL